MSQQKQPQLKLNLNAPAYIPKTKINPPPQQSASKYTSLNVNSAAFIPKSKKTNTPSVTSQPRTQPEKPKPKKIVREYFVLDEDDKQEFNFDYDYMISFENWEICQETKLLSDEFLKHLEDFKIVETEQIKQNNTNNKGKKKYYGDKRNKEEKKKETVDLSNFGRKDFSKEISMAEQFKKKIDEEAEKDPIRFKITEYLNILTVDNYKNTAEKIYEIIEKILKIKKNF